MTPLMTSLPSSGVPAQVEPEHTWARASASSGPDPIPSEPALSLRTRLLKMSNRRSSHVLLRRTFLRNKHESTSGSFHIAAALATELNRGDATLPSCVCGESGNNVAIWCRRTSGYSPFNRRRNEARSPAASCTRRSSSYLAPPNLWLVYWDEARDVSTLPHG